ncbi:hypothetical protein [Streptomyces sp. NPDC051310]|uniref:hypothetical protein n=1 Tax=Streptomyces sp. NPDC051310 TaxID=3365649 RepID=UPI0037B3746F
MASKRKRQNKNGTARALDRSERTISLHCADMGLTFDRSAAEAATRARMADSPSGAPSSPRPSRATPSGSQSSCGCRPRSTSFGGKDNTYAQRQVDEPRPT